MERNFREEWAEGEIEAGTLLDAIDRLRAERDAILMQARIWASEAKTQQAITKEVGAILGGVPDWGPIASGVEALRRDAERYQRLGDHFVSHRTSNKWRCFIPDIGGALDESVDALTAKK